MKKIIFISLVGCVLLAITLTTFSLPSHYSLRSDVINNGSSHASASNYQLVTAIGQTNIGLMKGDAYQLTNGFLTPKESFLPPVDDEFTLYLPVAIR